MSNHKNDRALGRMGARELTPQEWERIAGSGPQLTNVITINPKTGRDGDG
jgi:hypothetical protein